MPDAHGNGRPREVASEGVRVLVIEDHADYARLLARFLGRAGHEAMTAGRGPEAIEVARGFRPGFVLLDPGMPGPVGEELARRLRREGGCEGAVLIAVCDDGPGGGRPKRAGFDCYLAKPLDPDALLGLLSARAGGT